MAHMTEYTLTDELGRVMQSIQIEMFGEDEYYANGIGETWDGVERLAERYGLRDKAEAPYLLFISTYDLTREQRSEILFDEAFSPYIECVRERELPPAEAGKMYIGEKHTAKSFSEITWHERVAKQTSSCRSCQGTEYRDEPFFPLVVTEDDGSASLHWTWCENIWSDMANNYGEILSWDGASPLGFDGECPSFDWS